MNKLVPTTSLLFGLKKSRAYDYVTIPWLLQASQVALNGLCSVLPQSSSSSSSLRSPMQYLVGSYFYIYFTFTCKPSDSAKSLCGRLSEDLPDF